MKLNYFNILAPVFSGLIRHFNREPELSFARGSEVNVFSELLRSDNLEKVVNRRVSEYGDPGKDQWFTNWFMPTLEQIHIREISWEELVELAKLTDPDTGDQLANFYEKCLEFNKYVPKGST